MPVQRLDTSLFDTREEPEEPVEKREAPRVKKLQIPEFTSKEITKTEVTDVKRLDRTLFERQEPEETLPEKEREKPKKLVIPEFTIKEIVKQEEVVPVQKVNTRVQKFHNFRSKTKDVVEQRKGNSVNKGNEIKIPDFEGNDRKEVHPKKLDTSLFNENKQRDYLRAQPVTKKLLLPEFQANLTEKSGKARAGRLEKDRLNVNGYSKKQIDVSHGEVGKLKGNKWRQRQDNVDNELTIHKEQRNQTHEVKNHIRFVEDSANDMKVLQHEILHKEPEEKTREKRFEDRETVSIRKQGFAKVDRTGTAFVDVNVHGKDKTPRKTFVDRGRDTSVDVPVNHIDLQQKQNQSSDKWGVQSSQITTHETVFTSHDVNRAPTNVDVTVRRIDFANPSSNNDRKWGSQGTTLTTVSSSAPATDVDINVRRIDVLQENTQPSFKWGVQNSTQNTTSSSATSSQNGQRGEQADVDVNVTRIELSRHNQPENNWGVHSSKITPKITSVITPQDRQGGTVDADVNVRRIDVPQHSSQPSFNWNVQKSQKSSHTTTTLSEMGQSKTIAGIDVTVKQIDLPQQHSTQSSTSQNNQSGVRGASVIVRQVEAPHYQQNSGQGVLNIQRSQSHEWRENSGSTNKETRARQTQQRFIEHRQQSKIVKTDSQKVSIGGPGVASKEKQIQVNQQNVPGSERTWQEQRHGFSQQSFKEPEHWTQTHKSETTGPNGEKITRYSYQTQYSSSSQHQSFHEEEAAAAHFGDIQPEGNFPALTQKDGKWIVRRVSVDDKKSSHAPLTSSEVKPLEMKVSLGAKDRNASQRKELMNEFKQKTHSKSYEEVLDDGTRVKRTVHISGGTSGDPGNRTSVQSVKEHVVMSKRY